MYKDSCCIKCERGRNNRNHNRKGLKITILITKVTFFIKTNLNFRFEFYVDRRVCEFEVNLPKSMVYKRALKFNTDIVFF